MAELKVTVAATEDGAGNRITFPEKASREVVENAILLLTAVPNVTELDFGGSYNFDQCDAEGARIIDPSLLTSIANLKSVDLACTPVSEIGPLAGLTNLQSLWLDDTQVSDVGSLAGLSNPPSLYLHNTQLSDVGPLAGLANLQSLYLANTQVSQEQVARLREALPDLRISGP